MTTKRITPARGRSTAPDPATDTTDKEDVWKPPSPHRPQHIETIWLDITTGHGIDEQGRPVEPIMGGSRTKRPILVDLLNTARHHHAERIVLCGTLPDTIATVENYLLGADQDLTKHAPGWEMGTSIHTRPPAFTGRYVHTGSGHKIVVRTTEEWFRGENLTPEQARWATRALTGIVQEVTKTDWPLDSSASATGINLWKMHRSKSYPMERCDPVLGRIIQQSEPQHRIEHFVDGPSRCDCGDCLPLIPADTQIPDFVYADGRFMFHGVVAGEMGAAPLTLLQGDDAVDLFLDDQYWPARYNVTFTVPDHWNTLGLLPVRLTSGGRGWHYPNRPGSTHTTWVDAVELRVAMVAGWVTDDLLEIHEAIKLSKVDPLRGYANAISRMVEIAEVRYANNQRAVATVTGAIKHMYRVTIGAFARTEALTTRFTKDEQDIPADAVSFRTIRDVDTDEVTGYEYDIHDRPGDADSWHPEIAARVWASARTRVLSNSTTWKEATAGALLIAPDELIGIQGDAIYTSTVQPWTLPVEHGGLDDGKNGRIRLKGIVPGPIMVPDTSGERLQLSKLADINGYQIDQADDQVSDA